MPQECHRQQTEEGGNVGDAGGAVSPYGDSILSAR